ncbi:hypothetical protein CGLO_16845 [Colletotrichum gloeosporioides Cg-14]|uniref:SH3 domain-containing protein n=1 Tax=Colletotrichum gloeosporioides (strain Cg-14) TaxID=1237896 RepID=T0L7W2_COLGC|nr:hypothetical protein CGLO_16845 [Colletotrichum gloeosporioides Cg-14]
MTESIADVVLAALSDLKRLLETVRESDDLSLRTSLLPKLDDELARLKAWAGNSGAHRTGRASLEHRLRDASHIRQQVLRLLHDLKDSLEDAADIMNGKATPWEETEDDEEPLDDLETETEMEQIALDVTELVDCLLRLSVSIQNPAPHDRFMSSTFTDTSAFEKFDIQHVQAKFQDIDEGLAQRLGKAMSRRRQYFKYREAHHQKLSHGLDRHGDTNKTEQTLPAPSTLASSIPLQMKQEVPIDLSGDDTQSDGRVSVTSFATSVSGPKTLKVPPMPEDALKGPFMCPFCYLIVSVQDTRDWNGAIPESKVDSIVELSSQPLAQDAHTECPFCPEKFKSLKKYRRHVGNHQQDLALFVLPKTEDGDENSEESHFLSENHSDDVILSAQDEELIDALAQNQVSATAAGDGPTDDVQQPRIRNSLDDPLASRTFSVSPTRSFSISPREEGHNDRVPENLDGDLPVLRGFTPPRSVSSWYDEPVSAEFSEDEVLPINPEQSSHNAVSGTQIRQSFDGDQVNWLPQRPLTGTSDNLVDIEISSIEEPIGDYATSHGIGDGAGNKRRASSPPDDIDSGLEEECLRQRVPLPRSPINACRNCRRRNIQCLEGGLESKCRHCNQEGLECTTDGIPGSASYKTQLLTYPENQDASSQSLLSEVPVEAADADNENIKAKVLYNFAGKAANEITARNGDLVDILHQNDTGWSFAKHILDQEGSGWIPTAYVEPLTTKQLLNHLQLYEEHNKIRSKLELTASRSILAEIAAIIKGEMLERKRDGEEFLTEREKFLTEREKFLTEGKATSKNAGLLEKKSQLPNRQVLRESGRMINESFNQQERRYHNASEFTEEFPPDSWEAGESMNAGSANIQRRRPQQYDDEYDDDDVHRSTEQPNETERTNDEAPSINHKESHPPPDVTTTTHDRERRNQVHTNEAPTSPKGTKRRSKKERKLISKLGFETVECHVPGCEFETDFPNRNDFERHFRAWHPQNEDLITKLDALTCPNAYCKGMVAYTNESQFRGHMLRVHVIDVKPGGKTSLGKAGASDDNKTIKNRR